MNILVGNILGGGSGGGAADGERPTIIIVSPAVGSVIGQSTAIRFKFIDDVALRRPTPMIRFEKRDSLGALLTYHYELIHDGEEFTPDYSGTRVAITGGYEYINVQRRSGWSGIIQHEGGSPTLVPFGTDTGGNEPA